jgi:hypothetical protein
MKKNLSLSALALLVLSAMFSGCSKENPVAKDQNVSAFAKNNDLTNNSSRLAPKHFGFISGMLAPVPMKAAITAYNYTNTSAEVTPAADGSFIINDLVPGVYAVKVDYVPFGGDEYSTLIIEKVVVSAGTLTNLGVISLN